MRVLVPTIPKGVRRRDLRNHGPKLYPSTVHIRYSTKFVWCTRFQWFQFDHQTETTDGLARFKRREISRGAKRLDKITMRFQSVEVKSVPSVSLIRVHIRNLATKFAKFCGARPFAIRNCLSVRALTRNNRSHKNLPYFVPSDFVFTIVIFRSEDEV